MSRTNGGHWRVGVPPGVGDTYWCLTKLKALRAARSLKRVTLCIQQSRYERAVEWAGMVDFVDDVCVEAFESPGDWLKSGYLQAWGNLDCLLWPGAVLDRGGHLDQWLPELQTDLNFLVRAPDMGAPRVVLYTSSVAINESWTGYGAEFWQRLLTQLTRQHGRVTLVGAAWDESFRHRLGAIDAEDLIGKTTLPELAGIVRDARLVVGVICGVSIVSNHFRTPCVAIYPDHKFPPTFPYAWVAKDAPYRAIATSEATALSVLAAAAAIIR